MMKSLNDHNTATLVLFTASFPYGKGEQFLETEIKYLSLYFNKVIIIPQIVDSNYRSIPNNVIVNNSFVDHSIIKKIIFVFFSLFSKIFWKECFRKPKIIFSVGAIRLLIAYYSKAISVKFKLKRFIIDNDLHKTLFYSYWLDSSALGMCLLKLEKTQKKITCISRIHRYDLYEERQSFNYLPLRNFFLKNVNILFPISNHGKNYILNKYIVNHNKVIVSKLGVNDSGFISKKSTTNELHIVSCSFLVPVKRINLIIDAINIFANSNSNKKIYWSHLGDGLLHQSLKEYAKVNLPDNVQYCFRGQLPNKEIIQFYKNNIVDVLVNVSESEGIPVSIMEAYSCGIPAIATAVGGVPEIVNDKNGWLLSSNPSTKEVAAAFNDALLNKNILDNKKEAAKKMWNKLYSAENNYSAFSEMLLQQINI
jgi:colanic acid/amylovoran biosynthesis glycosyltransferase